MGLILEKILVLKACRILKHDPKEIIDAEIIDGQPSPKSHIKTLMRIGYDLNSAISDIIDNSITAKANLIEILCPPDTEDKYISIIDDGIGMEKAELINNMRLGCKDPSDSRDKNDLGRFGSCMKTASFSQARRLIVISKTKNSTPSAACWDIDKIEKNDAWDLEVFNEKEIYEIDGVSMDLLNSSGTQLIWQKINKYENINDVEEIIASSMVELKRYISLYFHKFLSGPKKINIKVQHDNVEPLDPFLTNVDGHQELNSDTLRAGNSIISIKTHALPHISRLSNEVIKKYGGIDNIYKNQGFYIYRANRLIIAGGWMGINNTNILGNLARVEINIPVSMDDQWTTDVKKSSLQIPYHVKRRQI